MELIALLWNQANDPLMCWAWHSKTTVFMSSEWLVQRMIRRPLLEKTLHRSKCLKCNVICGKFIVCSVDDSIQCALLCAVCSMYVHIKECAHLCRNVHICEQCAHACAYVNVQCKNVFTSVQWRQSVTTTKWCVAATFRSSSGSKAKCHKVATFLHHFLTAGMIHICVCVGWWQLQSNAWTKVISIMIMSEVKILSCPLNPVLMTITIMTILMMWKMVAMMRVILIAIDHIGTGRQASPTTPPLSSSITYPYPTIYFCIFTSSTSQKSPVPCIGLFVAKELQGTNRAVVEWNGTTKNDDLGPRRDFEREAASRPGYCC